MYALEADSFARASRCAPSGWHRPRSRVWAGYFGNDAEQRDNGLVYGYRSRWHGVASGYAFDLSPAFTAGAYFAFGRARSDYPDLKIRIDTDLHQAGLYGVFRPIEAFRLGFDIAAGWHDNTGEHFNGAGPFRSDFRSRLFGAGVDMRYTFRPLPAFGVTPFASARYQHLLQDAVSETGGAIPIMAENLAALSAVSFASELGLETSWEFPLSKTAAVTPKVFAAWRHEFGDRRLIGAAAYSDSPIQFPTVSVERPRDSLEAGADLKAAIGLPSGGVLELRAGYGFSVMKTYCSHNWLAELGLRF